MVSGRPFLNGIRYLLENIEWGVETDLTQSYRNTVVSRCGVGTLDDAEQKCDGTGDVLDAVLCAAQAAWALSLAKSGY